MESDYRPGCPILQTLGKIRSGGYNSDESLPPVTAPMYSGGSGEDGGGGGIVEVAMDQTEQWVMMEQLSQARSGGGGGGILGRIVAMAAGNHISNVTNQARAAVERGQAAVGNNAGDRFSYMATHSPHGRVVSAVLGREATAGLAHQLGDMAGSAAASLGGIANSAIDNAASRANGIVGSAEPNLGEIYNAVDQHLLRPQLERAYAAASRELEKRMPQLLGSKWARALDIPTGTITGGGEAETVDNVARMIRILGRADANPPAPPPGLTDREKNHIPKDLSRAVTALGARLQNRENYYAELMRLMTNH